MRYAGLLAGGIGSRMGHTSMPKQFLNIGDRPIIIHTLEQFIISQDIDRVVIAIPEKWIAHMESLVKKYLGDIEVDIIPGGNDRNDTIVNVCTFINEKYEVNGEDILLTHDAVRPFITQRIIKENIKLIEDGQCDVCDTVIGATDTIVESIDGKKISNIPDRSTMYQGQTPQTFKLNLFLEVFNSLTNEEKNTLTDAAKIFAMKDYDVRLVDGEPYNIKITTAYDLSLANALLNLRKKGELND